LEKGLPNGARENTVKNYSFGRFSNFEDTYGREIFGRINRTLLVIESR